MSAGATRREAAICLLAKEHREGVLPAKELRKDLLGLPAREATAAHARAVEALSAKLVVGLPLLLIGEHLIGLRHLLEILLRELLVFARVFVRVVLDGELLVRCAQRQHTDSA